MTATKILKQREIKTLRRLDSTLKACSLLKEFFEKGFTEYAALSAIVLNFYPELKDTKLWDYWHLRSIDFEITNILESVLEKLKWE